MTYQTNTLETPLFGDPHDEPSKPSLHSREAAKAAYVRRYANFYESIGLPSPVTRLHTHGAVAPRVREPSIEDVEHVKQLHGRQTEGMPGQIVDPWGAVVNWEGCAKFLNAGFDEFRRLKNERIAALELQIKQLQGSLEALEAQIRQPTPKSKGEVLGAALKFDPLPGSYGR